MEEPPVRQPQTVERVSNHSPISIIICL